MGSWHTILLQGSRSLSATVHTLVGRGLTDLVQGKGRYTREILARFAFSLPFNDEAKPDQQFQGLGGRVSIELFLLLAEVEVWNKAGMEAKLIIASRPILPAL